jgi:hypothetical protein
MSIKYEDHVPQPKDTSKRHFYISIVKSALRLTGCLVAAYTSSVVLLALFFAAAEFLGIAEEL